jgi:hypothetical protein
MPVPVSIKVFLAFSAVVSLLDLTILVPGLIWLKQAVTPFTGWGGNVPFFFALGTWPGLFKGGGYSIDAKTLRRYLTLACFMMAVGVLVGGVDFWMFGDLRSDENPWLRYHPLRPLWSMVLPLAWGIVLWIERGRITPQPVEASADLQGTPAISIQSRSAAFFTVFWCALMIWAFEAAHYWGLWWGYWGNPHRTPYTKWLMIVLAIACLASLSAGDFFKRRESL